MRKKNKKAKDKYKQEEAILKRLKLYPEISDPLYKKHCRKLLDEQVAQYVSQNELTKGTQNNKLEEERWNKFKDYEQERLLNGYKTWFFTQFHATTGAELLFVRREYEHLGQLVMRGLILSPAHLEICLVLQEERKRLELQLRKEAAASVALNVRNKESATQAKFNQLMKEGERHLQSLELFPWELYSTLEEVTAKGVESSEEKELGVKQQKDKGLEEEDEVKKSAIEQLLNKTEEEVKKSAIEQLLNEASMKKIWKERMGAIKRESNPVMEEGKEHLNNLESFDREIRPWEEDKRRTLEEEITKLTDDIELKDEPVSGEEDKLWEAEIVRNVNPSYIEAVDALTERYKTWFHTRSHALTGALVLLLRECDRFKEQGLTRSRACLKICAFLRWECQLLAHSIHRMSKQQMALVYKELIAASKQEDEGLEEQEQVVKEIIKDLTNLEFLQPVCTPLEEKIAKGESSMKEQWKRYIKNLEDEGSEQEEEQAVEDIIRILMDFFEFRTSLEGELIKEVDKRWSLEEEVNKLIDETLRISFPGLGEKSVTFTCSKEEYGDYRCENVLSIWPKLIKQDTHLEGPKIVGETIKKELEKRSDMIEGTPCVRSFGFVTFKLSGKYMAKSLNEMVRYGIHTLAPKLPFKGVIVETPDFESSIWNSNVGQGADIIRSNLIRDTFIRMLEYSKVFVSKDEFLRDALSHVQDDIWSFPIEEIDVISANVEGKLKSLNFGKRGIQDIKDSLKILWCELKDDRAEWIVCLNPVRHQEYVEMCHTAAKDAGWIPTAEHHGLSFAGYKTDAEAGKLVYLLENALTRCNSLVKHGKAPEYTAERVFCCALGYEYLRTPRLLDCTFTVDEMLNEKGNTFLYLLNTKSQVLSVLASSGKDIELKNASESISEEVEILEIIEGRALGFHLLQFTEVLEECCLSVLPHILCRYLHSLCQKFTSYNCVSEVGSVAETLCRATVAVMEKCFHLLGITPVPIFGESLIQQIRVLSEHMGPNDPAVITSLARDPPKHMRFELSTIRPRLAKFKGGKLFGRIRVHDKHGMLSDGWTPTCLPDFGAVPLFSTQWYDAVEMVNNTLVFMGNPHARHSVPVTTSSVVICVELIVTDEDEKLFYHLPQVRKRFEVPRVIGDGVCGTIVLVGDEMTVLMYGVLLKDAVDADVEVTFRAKDERKFKGHLYAYYGSEFPYADDDVVKYNFMAEFLEPSSIITRGSIRLNRSKIAVPKNGSLVIEAKLVDVDTGRVVLDGCYEFPTKVKGHSNRNIRTRTLSCFLELKVNWKYS